MISQNQKIFILFFNYIKKYFKLTWNFIFFNFNSFKNNKNYFKKEQKARNSLTIWLMIQIHNINCRENCSIIYFYLYFFNFQFNFILILKWYFYRYYFNESYKILDYYKYNNLYYSINSIFICWCICIDSNMRITENIAKFLWIKK